MVMPRVISLFRQERFEDRFPEISILGEPTNVFLECISYDILIPVVGTLARPLDIFEEAVLRLVRLRGASIEDLADILCLEKDLIWFILNRLEDKGLLDDTLSLTNEGMRQLNVQNLDAEVKPIQGRIFVLRKTGQILPWIHIGEFQSEKVDEVTGKQIILGYGSAGKYERVPGFKLRDMNRAPIPNIYPSNRLQEAVFRFNRLMLLRNRKPIDYCAQYSITSSRSEFVYFHLQAVIQDGNSDEILFSDGFVPNIDGMMDYINGYPDVIDSIRKRAVQMIVTSDKEKIQRLPKQYWEIIQSYNKVRQYLPNKFDENVTSDERRETDKNRRQIVINCYNILEVALFYYLKEHPVSEMMMDTLKRKTPAQNEQIILKMAEHLGIRYASEARRLFSHVDKNRILSMFESGIANMHVCLPLAIVEAKESADSRIRILIQDHGGFLRFVQTLGNIAAKFRHDTEACGYDLDMPIEYIVKETAGIVCILLPDLQIDDGINFSESAENISQARLLAQISLSKAFGFIRFQMMSEGVRNEWMRISPDKTGKRLPEMSEYAQILYRIFQTVLANENRKFPNKHGISKAEAIQRLTNLYGKTLPRSISSVTEPFYNLAIQGNSSSLGAEMLVYSANSNIMDELIKLNFIQVVDKILKLRGHGGQVVSLEENEYTMGNLRNNVIELIKRIEG